MAKQIITYVGKTTLDAGKTLWEIVGNLKDLGVGRIVVRNRHLSLYDTPCYYRILSVRTRVNMEPERIPRFRWPTDHRHLDRPRMLNAICERVFRGVQYAEHVDLITESMFPDYALVPKHEEHKYRPLTTEQKVIDKSLFPTHVEYPPMLRRMLAASGEPDPKLEIVIKKSSFNKESRRLEPNLYRLAKDGEQATLDIPQGFGKVVNKKNLTGVDYGI